MTAPGWEGLARLRAIQTEREEDQP